MINKILTFTIVIFTVAIFINIFICATAFSGKNYNVYDNFDTVQKICGDEKTMLIVDFSESMNEMMGQKSKMDIALENISSILPSISPELQIGLRVYGHKDGFTVYQACSATELIVPPKKNSATAISNALYSMTPKGVTPITHSLKKSIENDFGNYTGKKHIILISDGKENCDESPCRFAIDLMKQREDIIIDVVALGIDDAEAIAQLKCTALTTNGKFYKSDTSAQLFNSLKNSFHSFKNVQGEIIMK